MSTHHSGIVDGLGHELAKEFELGLELGQVRNFGEPWNGSGEKPLRCCNVSRFRGTIATVPKFQICPLQFPRDKGVEFQSWP